MDPKIAVSQFYKNMKKASKHKSIKKPVTWALYETWRWVERNEKVEEPEVNIEEQPVPNIPSVSDPKEICAKCTMDRKVCTGCSEVLELEHKLRQQKLFFKED